MEEHQTAASGVVRDPIPSCGSFKVVQHGSANHATPNPLFAHTPRTYSLLQVFVQATEGLLSTTRFASTRFAQKERPPNLANPSMREGEGADGSPQRNENSPDLHGDTASANCSGKEGTGSGRRSRDNTRMGGSRGWVLMVDWPAAITAAVVYRGNTIPL